VFLKEFLEDVQDVWLDQSPEVLVKPEAESIRTWAFVSRNKHEGFEDFFFRERLRQGRKGSPKGVHCLKIYKLLCGS
jgi:hypothetical protein